MKRIFTKLRIKIRKKKSPLITSFLLVLVVISYQNCQTSDDMFTIKKAEFQSPILIVESPNPKTEEAKIEEPKKEEPDENLCEKGSTRDLICNPLSASGANQPKNYDVPSVPKSKLGLIAQLYEGEDNWRNMDQYMKEGYKHQEYIYFSNFNVPTRNFLQGFGFGETDFLKNRHGEKLIEWFAIHAKGNIVIPENESDGFYHIVTISDDGVRVKIDGNTLISNPIAHAPTIDCADSLVELKSKVEKPFELTYFQGPRTAIALMVFIKKIDDPASFKKSKNCSTQMQPQALYDEGYKVISPSWFTLPVGF